MGWIINTTLLRNPMNWLSIGAMLLLIAFGAIAIYSRHMQRSGMDAGTATTAKEA